MEHFLDSKLVSQLKDGELPKVTVKIEEETLIQMGAMLLLVGVGLFLSFQIIKKIK